MKFQIVTLLSILFSSRLYAHGMNKLGPHDGYINMPGAFHTELLEKKMNMQVYLLDMNFKNALVENSSVIIAYKGKKTVKFNCSPQNDYFICKKPATGLQGISEIFITSIRNNNKARDAIYKVPLKLDK